MNLRDIMLNERSQKQKVTYDMIFLYELPRIKRSIRTECRWEVARSFGKGKWGVTG